MFNGSILRDYFVDNWPHGTYDEGEHNDYTFPGYIGKSNETCSALGLVCSLSEPQNFTFLQTDPWTVQLYFEITRNITTADGAAGIVNDVVIVNQSFNIEGFIDPLVSEMMTGAPDAPAEPRRQMFPYKGDVNVSVSDVTISSTMPSGTTRGKGFFYGPIVTDPTLPVGNNTWKYILKTTWDDIASLPPTQRDSVLNGYGAFIITDASVNTTTTVRESENSGTYDLTYCGGAVVRTYTLYCRMRCEDITYSEEDCQFDCINETSTCTNQAHKICLNSGSYDDICFGGLINCGGGVFESVFDAVTPSIESGLCNFTAAFGPSSVDITLTNPTDKPYIVTESSIPDSVFGPPAINYPFGEEDSNESSRYRVLINNEYWIDTSDFNTLSDTDKGDRRSDLFNGYHELWNIENLREMAMCESYVRDDDGLAPSFFQRMIDDGEDLKGGNLSLESFVTGRWAVNDYSKVDYEYAQSISISTDNYLKGMPGNKMQSQVTDASSPIGHFGLSSSAINRYGLTDTIECGRDVKCT
ncbi:MAG: hypothetical protein DRP79_09545 [Planctomycetota bacterium]|nr:MAG: hypothetical protein DRP79_09545 [Planctomycetota bacterium]